METPSTPSNGSHSSYQIPTGILDDLCSRFIINIPEEERQDLIRIFFQIELAHWFYLDFYCQENAELKASGIKDFSRQIFKHCPTLSDHADNVDKTLGEWKEYKMAVPTYGAIMLDPTMTHCLLVQGFWSKASWGFPKGKVNEGEISHDCAIREIDEETGFDVSKLLDREEYIEYKMNEQLCRLYIIPGVSMKTKFAPKTRKEIKKLEWFKIEYLPSHKKDIMCKTQYGLNPNAFFMVIPFVKQLKRWVSKKNDPSNNSSSKNKQKQQFQKMMQNEYDEYMKFKEPKGKTKDLPSQSPAVSGKGGRRTSSPRQGSKHIQILTRDKCKKSLAPQFAGSESQKHHKTKQQPFTSVAWMNFKLDSEAVMACLL